MTAKQADALVQAAEAYAGEHGWTTNRHYNYPTTDLPWYVLSPEAQTIVDDVWRAMASNVKKRCGLGGDDKLTINDVFLVKYTPDGQPGLHRHRDGSFASFNLMLSDPEDYEGGGTRMWDSAEVDRHKADYWEYETRHRANRTTAPRGGWDAYDPDAGVLKPEHATLYRLRKGQMLTAGGFNFHEGLPVTRGARYIVAGFVGLNKHCCAFKYAGWRGVFGFLRVHMMRRSDEKYGKNDIPQYDWRMYQEGRKAARTFLFKATSSSSRPGAGTPANGGRRFGRRSSADGGGDGNSAGCCTTPSRTTEASERGRGRRVRRNKSVLMFRRVVGRFRQFPSERFRCYRV